MAGDTLSQELLEFFKALAEPKRLQIVGLLARGPHTGEQLAALLELSEGTVSHHLSYLVHAGLVSAQAQGYYSVYTLRLDAIHATARRLLDHEQLPRLAAGVNMDAYDEKIVKNFTDAQGRIKQFPAQQKKLEVVLRYVLKDFEREKRYTEKQVNEILARYNSDIAYLRRSLIDLKLMARDSSGAAYWRIDPQETAAG